MQQSKQFDRLEQYAKLQAPPIIKFKDLQLESFMSNHKLMTGPFFPFDVRTDYVKVTDDTVLVPITVQIRNRDITFNNKDGVDVGEVHIIGRVSTITGKVVQSFEDTVEVEVPTELLTKTLDNKRLYWKSLPLRPGRYRVDIGVKDVNNPDHLGVWAQAVNVPKYDDDKLSASSLILAQPHGAGAVQRNRRRKFCHRQHKALASRHVKSYNSGILPADAKAEFLDAGV